jgi:hypothetical protein
MTELQELQDRIAQMELEMIAAKARAKTQAVRQRFVVALATVVVGVGLVAQKGQTQYRPQARPPGVLVCRALKVVDQRGVVKLSLGVSPRDNGDIGIYNANNKLVARIGTDHNSGVGIVTVRNEQGVRMADLTSRNNQATFFLKR